jgi:predicted ATPase/class 3 adenylate cyclase
MRPQRSRAVSDANHPAPAGTVALLFTDIDGAGALAQADSAGLQAAIPRMRAIVRDAVEGRGGTLFKVAGDGCFGAFASVAAAVSAARDAQVRLLAEAWEPSRLRVRAAIHVGAVEARDGDYFGRPLNRTARILALGHGGQILLSSAAAELAGDALVGGAALRDLGSHRLKDIEHAERLFALVAPDLPADFPPVRSPQAAPNNLPIQLTRFVGRERESRDVRARLADAHLLTLVGFGGIGKSRLALEVGAASFDRFPDGVWFVDLSPIRDPDVVADEIARAAGVVAGRGELALDATIAALHEKKTLLIVDGCEHLLQAVARAVAAILRACPHVRVVATTREALGLAGETVYDVNPFAVPPAGVCAANEARGYPAVELFVERCAAASATFTITDDNAPAVAEICRKLDGIALALELAAPKMAVLGPRALADRLNERFRLLRSGDRTEVPRRQTLRALIDWSYDLLDEDERTIFRRVCSFAGTWTLESAGAVCADDDIDSWRVFDLVSSLVSKSLVATEPGSEEQRFHILDSIAEYGREKLASSGEAERLAAGTAAYYAGLLRELERSAGGALDEEAWRRTVEPEIDNIRASVDWTVLRGNDPALGRALLTYFDWPHSVTSPSEAVRWFDAAAHAPPPFASAREEARFYRHYARLAWVVGRPIAWREETACHGLAVAQAAGDAVDIALARKYLGAAYLDGGRHEDADRVFAEALAAPGLPDAVVTDVLNHQAINDLEKGDFERSRERFAAVARRERAGSLGQGKALLNLAELAFACGDFEAARSSGRAAADILKRLRAAPLALLACNRAAYEMAADALDEARACLREALDYVRDSGQVWAVTALEHHAVYSGLAGELERALVLLGYTDHRIRSGGATRKKTERYGHARLEALLARAFGEDDMRRRLHAGSMLTHEQALALAGEIHART